MIKALKVFGLSALLVLAGAVPAFAEPDLTTPTGVRTEFINEATPWISGLVLTVAAIFGLTLVFTFAAKVAGMIRGRMRKAPTG